MRRRLKTVSDSTYKVRVERPHSVAVFNTDNYDGRVGYASNKLRVKAYYHASRPDPGGLPNRFTIEVESESRTDTVVVNREGAKRLIDMLDGALHWPGDSKEENK